MALPDLTGEKVNDTYQRLLQITSSNVVLDGTGSNVGIRLDGPLEVNGTSRTLFTSASMVYSGSNVTQVTQSFQAGTQQITNILYSGSFADGNPLSIAVTGSDGINKLYTMEYSASVITQITVT